MLASLILAIVADARASTYVVYIPLDSPIYDQLDTLDGLGYLDDYLSEVRPISRVEAARLTREAERNVDDSERKDPLAREMVDRKSTRLNSSHSSPSRMPSSA